MKSAVEKEKGRREEPAFSCDDQREEVLAASPDRQREEEPPAGYLFRRYQAALRSFSAFSKAVLTGFETSSAAFEATAWNSLACSTVCSTRLRR